jgi:REP element-mobilizing transposase RayT
MADIFASKYKLKSSRLNNFDYSSSGIYFITICTYHHNNFFGKIINQQMELSKMGMIVNQCLIDIPKHFKKIILDEYIVMPNHVHILFHVETPYMASLQTNSKVKIINYSHKNHPDFYKRLNQKSNQLIPKIIQQFKSAVTRQINPKTIFFAWQPRYHDIIVKDERQYSTIKNYIKNNVINWERDKYFKK